MRRWLSASIVNRVTLAAATLTASVVLLLAVVSYGAVSALIRGSVEDTVRGHAALATEVMESELNAFSKELGGLAANTLVVTGLLDATARDVHLLPFLRDYRSSISATATLAVCDFRGRPITANQFARSCGSDIAVHAALASGKAHAHIVRNAGQVTLLLAQPMFYPGTSNVEGILAGAVDISAAFTRATAFLHPKYQKRLLAAGSALAGDAEWVTGGERVQVWSPLNVASPLDGLGLQVDIGLERDEAFAALRWVTAAYVGVGALVLILAFWMARAMARRITAPVIALSRTAARIAESGSMTESAPASGNDEIGTLALSFNDMLRRLRDSHELLEHRVAERTSELRRTEQQLSGILGAMNEVVWSVSPDTFETLYVSPGIERLYGRKAEEFLNNPQMWLDAMHPADRERVARDFYPELLRSGSVVAVYRIERPDGETRWVEDRGRVVRDGGDNIVRLDGIVTDISERKLAEEALRQSEQRLRLHFEQAPLAVIEWGPEFRVTKWNAAAERIFGYTGEEALGRHASFIVPAGAQGDVDRVWQALIARTGGERNTNENVCKDGRMIQCEWYNTALVDAAGEVIGVASLVNDVTERRQADQALRLRDRAIESSVNAILISANSGPDNPIEYVNPAFERITGYSAEEALGRDCRFLQGEDREQPELERIRTAIREHREGHALLRNYRKDGSLFWNDLRVAPVRNEAGDVTHFVGVLNDVTEAKRYQTEMEHQATHDGLTGVANRTLLNDRLAQETRNAQRYGRRFAVAFIDLDRFKLVNDGFGHSAGDLLLKAVAERLKSLVRDSDTVARLGGDEFVLLWPDQKSEETPMQIAQRVLERLAQPYALAGREAYVTCSIGVSIYPQDGHDPETLLRNADAALYRAKETGRNNVYFYSEGVNAKLRERLSLQGSLRRAVDQRQFVLHYQPKLELSTRRVAGLEALLRWQDPDRGLVSPADFIPVLEETGMIVEVGRQVLEMAAADYARLLSSGLKPPRIAVNVSQRQLQRRDFVGGLKDAASSWPDVGAWLDLEITESLLMADVEENAAKLKMIREMGVKIAIDDFGTGYSSLNYLARLPVGALKIDRSFISRITSDPDGMTIVSTIISLAHSLKMKVVAEGVETEEQARLLKLLRCDEIQGYLVGRPAPLTEIENRLAQPA